MAKLSMEPGWLLGYVYTVSVVGRNVGLPTASGREGEGYRSGSESVDRHRYTSWVELTRIYVTKAHCAVGSIVTWRLLFEVFWSRLAPFVVERA